MPNKGKTGHGRERRISVHGVRRDAPDLHKLSRALIELAMAQAEADAEAEVKLSQPKAADD